MSKWIAEFELEDGDTMPEHMDLEYKGAKIDFHCRLLEQEKGHWVEDIINGKAWYSCSECLHVISNYEGCFHYCPCCGKELKGVIENDKNK